MVGMMRISTLTKYELQITMYNIFIIKKVYNAKVR